MMARDRGMALINALIIVAMLSAAAVTLQARALRGVSMGQLQRDTAQAAIYLDGATQLAQLVLRHDMATSSFDSLDEDWARPDYMVPVDRGRIALTLRDQQGLFNLNLLADPDDPSGARPTFLRLCNTIGIAPRKGAQLIAQIQRDGPLRLMASLSGLTSDERGALQQVATFLPRRPALNINTAPRAVLAAHLPELNAEALATLLDLRAAQPFEDADGFAAAVRARVPVPERDEINFRRFATGSDWFAAFATAELGETRLSRYTLLHRSAEDDQIRRELRVNGWE